MIAFSRASGNKRVIVVAPRFFTRLIRNDVLYPLGMAVWDDTVVELPGEVVGRYRNIFTGELLETEEAETHVLPLAAACGQFPVAMLERLPVS